MNKEHLVLRVGWLLDYETRSRKPINHGTHVYATDPSTEVLCFAMAPVYLTKDTKFFVDRENMVVWDSRTDYDPFELDIEEGDTLFAFNAMFEYYILNEIMVKKFGAAPVKIENLYCLAALASYNGLPAKLSETSKALPLTCPKDMEGHKVMMAMCKPNSKGEFPYSDEMHDRLIQYCKVDILSEAELLETLDPFSKEELDFCINSFKIDDSGIPLDMGMVKAADEIVEEERARIGKLVPINLKSHVQIKKYAAERGLEMASTDADHVQKYLKMKLDPEVRTMLEAKALGIGSSSVSKFSAMLNCVSADGRLRSNYRHHGAMRTGRYTAGGVQVTNLPRGEKYTQDLVPELREMIRAKDIDGLHMLTDGRPMDALKGCVRSSIASPEGYTYVQRDLSAIEARGVLWVAGADGLSVFTDFDKGIGDEPYMIFAKKLNPENPDRFMGKQGILSTGYGIGKKAFISLCEGYGKNISETEAEICLDLYKEMFPEVPAFWKLVEGAAKNAIEYPGSVSTVETPTNPVKFTMQGKNLKMKLPSGRVLTYFDARLDEGDYGPQITYMTSGTEGGKNVGWHRTRAWGGSMTGHIVQGFSSCILRHILRELDRAGIPATMHVHDEAVVMVKDEDVESCFNLMGDIMKAPPTWAKGLPIQSAGWKGKFYIKD